MLEKNDNKGQLNKSKRDYKIEVVDSKFVLNRWDEIKEILESVFRDYAFNGDSQDGEKYSRNRPINHTWKKINEPDQEGLKHIIALDLDNNILGAFFVVPDSNPEGIEDCDPGWFFSVELYPRFRHEIINALFNKAHEIIKNAGFKRIVANMGTEAGAKFLSKKHGYIHTPNPERYNTWTKELN